MTKQKEGSFLRSVRLHSDIQERITAILKVRGETFNEMVNRMIRAEAVPDRCPTCGQRIKTKGRKHGKTGK